MKKVRKDGVFCRDSLSACIFRKYYSVNAKIYPDPVFLYGLNRESKNEKSQKIMCNILSYTYFCSATHTNDDKEGYFEKWMELVENNRMNNETVVLSYTTIEDSLIINEFADYLKRIKNGLLNVRKRKV